MKIIEQLKIFNEYHHLFEIKSTTAIEASHAMALTLLDETIEPTKMKDYYPSAIELLKRIEDQASDEDFRNMLRRKGAIIVNRAEYLADKWNIILPENTRYTRPTQLIGYLYDTNTKKAIEPIYR